ncbi:hypothetical protein FACS18949_17460 [Clostridia bacterium]|nr:hypothetical protein FACS18949_17460 [Clostridia bacterium]
MEYLKPESAALSAKLRVARLARGLTMLATAEQLGIALPIYKLIEAGKIYPDSERLTIICNFFGFATPEDER